LRRFGPESARRRARTGPSRPPAFACANSARAAAGGQGIPGPREMNRLSAGSAAHSSFVHAPGVEDREMDRRCLIWAAIVTIAVIASGVSLAFLITDDGRRHGAGGSVSSSAGGSGSGGAGGLLAPTATLTTTGSTEPPPTPTALRLPTAAPPPTATA